MRYAASVRFQPLQLFAQLLPLHQAFLNGRNGLAYSLPFLLGRFPFGRCFRLVRRDVLRLGGLPLFQLLLAASQSGRRSLSAGPIDGRGNRIASPLLQRFCALILLKLPVYFHIGMGGDFFQSLLPLADVQIQVVEVRAAQQPDVPFLAEGRPFSRQGFQLANLLVDFPNLRFQLRPFLRAVGRKLGDVGQILHALERVLSPLVYVPGSDRHGDALDLLLRFFDAQPYAVFRLVGRLLLSLKLGELVFVVGQSPDAVVKFALLRQQGVDRLLPLRRSDEEIAHLADDVPPRRAHAHAAFDAEKLAAHRFVGQDLKALQIFQAHSENFIVGLPVQAVPPQVGRLVV